MNPEAFPDYPKAIGAFELHEINCAPKESDYSLAHIRATWNGTGSVAEASRAFGFSRATGYELIRRGAFPCRVLRIGRTTRVVTASLLRVLESGEPEYNTGPVCV
ncbi:helix-turn-helix transcriptional regulator [Streptomyces sp. NPDC058486]|uniref:helix-turn-helix transcriptional regulator n=1 Tax=unclassified Streptomyces TaxID=2593676 RepID=UPI003655E665